MRVPSIRIGLLAVSVGLAALLAFGAGTAAADATASRLSVLPKGFSRLHDVAPSVLQEIRYYGRHNFVGRRISGYRAPECWLTTPAARAVARVQARVRRLGYTLKAYDCYRPRRAVSEFFAWSKLPNDDRMRAEFYPQIAKDQLFALGYIAERSGHSRGSTIDLTLVPRGKGVSPRWRPGDRLVSCTAPVSKRFKDTSIDMGTGFDCFDPLANTANPSISPRQKANRATLVTEMNRAGFTNLPEEWWHYTLRNEPFPDTYFNTPIRR